MTVDPNVVSAPSALGKVATGIVGFDDITRGGLPAGRASLICGAAGCGKTLFGMTFLVRGAINLAEPGVFMSFDERPRDLIDNVASLGYDLQGLIDRKLIAIDYLQIDRSQIAETDEYDLEGLFVRLGHAIDSVGAKRVVLDGAESLFARFTDEGVIRTELRRLLTWLKERGVTTIVTGERDNGRLTRHGFAESVCDCVVLLDNRVAEQVSTRRLRVVKYRGSCHGTSEYPFFIDEQGISVLPITAAGLDHQASQQIIPSGIDGLDRMLAKGGFYRGSSVLVSGLAGTGKTTFGSSFINACCKRGERCLFFSFEESQSQLVRNLESVGIELDGYLASGLLRIESARPSLYGLEVHLSRMYRAILDFNPHAVVIDPITAFRGPESEVHATLLRLIDLLKEHGITAVFTSFSDARIHKEGAEREISSLMDVWVSLGTVEADGEHNRLLYVLKARGMGHSNQVREYHIDSRGISLVRPYVGPHGVLTGSARLNQEAREFREADLRKQLVEQRRREKEKNRQQLERKIAEMRDALESEEVEENVLLDDESRQLISDDDVRQRLAQARGAVE